jgi:hypothetical protein
VIFSTNYNFTLWGEFKITVDGEGWKILFIGFERLRVYAVLDEIFL